MIIISDTSPINNLAAINQLHLLQQIYGTVIIPEAVYRELSGPNFPVAGATEVQTLDSVRHTQNSFSITEALGAALCKGRLSSLDDADPSNLNLRQVELFY